VSAVEPPVLILDPHVTLVQAAEPQRPKVDVPDSIRNRFETDVLADAHDRDVHPARVPANTAVGADVPDLKPFVAKGTPLSERIRFGNPYSWKSRVKIGFASATAVDGNA
jgi:hypothetical protein